MQRHTIVDCTTMKRSVCALTLVGALWGCVAGPGAIPSLGPGQIASVTARETLGNTGVTLESPGLLRAAIDAQTAFNVCASHRAPCPPTSPSAARLAIGTDAGPAEADANGKLTLLMDKRLVWAISWTGIECRLRGGAAVDPAAAETPDLPKSCDTVAFVDAASGDFLFEVTYASQ